MKSTIASNAFATLAFLALAAASAAHAAPMPKGDPERGHMLSAQRCAACHGEDGNSTIPQNPRLAGLRASYIVKQVVDFQARRRNNVSMSAMVMGLTEQDIANLAAHFAMRKPIRAPLVPSPLREQGRQIYNRSIGNLTVTCADCHGTAGEGGMGPRLASQHAFYLQKELRDFASGARANDPGLAMGGDQALTMNQVANQLSEQEIKALAEYLSGL